MTSAVDPCFVPRSTYPGIPSAEAILAGAALYSTSSIAGFSLIEHILTAARKIDITVALPIVTKASYPTKDSLVMARKVVDAATEGEVTDTIRSWIETARVLETMKTAGYKLRLWLPDEPPTAVDEDPEHVADEAPTGLGGVVAEEAVVYAVPVVIAKQRKRRRTELEWATEEFAKLSEASLVRQHLIKRAKQNGLD